MGVRAVGRTSYERGGGREESNRMGYWQGVWWERERGAICWRVTALCYLTGSGGKSSGERIHWCSCRC